MDEEEEKVDANIAEVKAAEVKAAEVNCLFLLVLIFAFGFDLLVLILAIRWIPLVLNFGFVGSRWSLCWCLFLPYIGICTPLI